MRALSVLALGMVVLFGPGVREAAACKCAGSPETRAEAAAIRFVGWISAVTTDGQSRIARFVVERGERGVKTGEVVVVGTSLTSCGLRFEAGQRWEMAANQADVDVTAAEPASIWSGGCGGSVLIAEAAGEDIRRVRQIVWTPGTAGTGRAR